MRESNGMIGKLLRSGTGCIQKSDPGSLRSMSLEAVSRGHLRSGHQRSGELASGFADVSPPPGLTKREREVLQLLFLGKSSKEIAAELTISVRTVETHRANMMRKLNVHSVTELLHFARSYKLVELDTT
jgi:two-component system secretion response regulator SsrB